MRGMIIMLQLNSRLDVGIAILIQLIQAMHCKNVNN